MTSQGAGSTFESKLKPPCYHCLIHSLYYCTAVDEIYPLVSNIGKTHQVCPNQVRHWHEIRGFNLDSNVLRAL